jgi:hypothetical protein
MHKRTASLNVARLSATALAWAAIARERDAEVAKASESQEPSDSEPSI